MIRKLAILLTFLGLACSERGEARAETPPPPPAAAKPAPGLRAEGQGFVVEVKAPDKAAVGAPATVRVVLKPTAGYKVNKEFPTKLTVTPPAGVEVAKAAQVPSDATKFDEHEAVFDVAFTCKDAGDKKFEAAFKFAVCTSETCDPKSEKLAWTVPVK